MTPGDLAQRSRAGAIWSVLNSGAKHGMDLLVFLLLARWLAPQAFGLMALVSTAMVVAVTLVELGLTEALVQRKRLPGVVVDTAFWLLLGAAGGLAVALAAGGGAAAPRRARGGASRRASAAAAGLSQLAEKRAVERVAARASTPRRRALCSCKHIQQYTHRPAHTVLRYTRVL